MYNLFFSSAEIFIKFFSSLLFGGMLFFSVIVAPNVFKSLDEKNARHFIRNIFPKLYLWGIIFSTFMLVFLLNEINLNLILTLLILLGFIYSRQFLIPKINHASDNVKNNLKYEKKFKFLHLISVVIFSIQLIFLLVIFFKS